MREIDVEDAPQLNGLGYFGKDTWMPVERRGDEYFDTEGKRIFPPLFCLDATTKQIKVYLEDTDTKMVRMS